MSKNCSFNAHQMFEIVVKSLKTESLNDRGVESLPLRHFDKKAPFWGFFIKGTTQFP